LLGVLIGQVEPTVMSSTILLFLCAMCCLDGSDHWLD